MPNFQNKVTETRQRLKKYEQFGQKPEPVICAACYCTLEQC